MIDVRLRTIHVGALCATLALLLSCGGGGASSGPTSSGPTGPSDPGGPTTLSDLPTGVFPVRHLFSGAKDRTDIVPTVEGLTWGGGRFYFLNNGSLVSFDPQTNAFQFESMGFQGGSIVYEGGPWVIGSGGAFQTAVNGMVQGFDLGLDMGFVDSAASDGAGHVYLVCEGRRSNQLGPAVDAQLVQVDMATHTYKSYVFHLWGTEDDARSTAYPYSGLALDTQRGKAWILSSYFQEVVGVDLISGSISHFPDTRITYAGTVALDDAGNVLVDQPAGLLRMSTNEAFQLQSWPAGFQPGNWYTGGSPRREMVLDDHGRAWVSSDYGALACLTKGGESKVYQYSINYGGSDGWFQATGVAWEGKRLWVIANGNTNDATGVFHEYQIQSQSTSELPVAPTGTMQYLNSRVSEYGHAHFKAQAVANGSLLYQWYRGGVRIPWAYAADLDVPAATDSDQGDLSCVVTNWLYGKSLSTTLGPLTFSVVSAPQISSFQASQREIRSGDSTTLIAWFSGGVGRLDPGGISIQSGVGLQVTPISSTQYTLTATNDFGESIQATCLVQVDDSRGLIASFGASPSLVDYSGQSSLAWMTGLSPAAFSLSDDLGFLGPADVSSLSSYSFVPRRRQRVFLSAQASGTQGVAMTRVAARGLDPVIGHSGGSGYLDGTGDDARITLVGPMASRPDGSLIFAEHLAPVLRMVDASGRTTTVAGRYDQAGDIDGPASNARFTEISGIAAAPDGSVFIADTSSLGKLKKLSPDGPGQTVQTFVSHLGETGPIAMGGDGTIYMSQRNDGSILRIAPDGSVATAVTGLIAPGPLVVQPVTGNLIILSDMGYAYQVSPDGTISQFYLRLAPGDPAGSFLPLFGITIDGAGQIYVAGGRGVFSVDPTFGLQSLCQVDGSEFGSGYYTGIAWSSVGHLWVGHRGSGAQIEQLVPGNPPVRVAGLIRPYPDAGTPTPADVMTDPVGLAAGNAGSFYVADARQGRILHVGASGAGTELPLGTLAGDMGWSSIWADASARVYFSSGQQIRRFDPVSGLSTPIVVWTLDGRLHDGTFGVASAGDVRGIVGDHFGNVYFASTVSESDLSIGEAYIRKITPGGGVVTVAGGGRGFVDGSGSAARFNTIRGIALDPQGSIVIADMQNHAIRRMTPDGTVTTIAGIEGQGYRDGAVATAQFSWPTGVAVDKDGYIYVADWGNSALRMISPEGQVTTLVGGPSHPGTRQGTLSYASLFHPMEVLVNADGDVLLTDSGQVLQLTAPRGN